MENRDSSKEPEGGRKILSHTWYLYVTEFFAGMSLMAVEISAQRLISPYFSSSQVVWTIIIGTIMIAMALGNVYGGRAADRDPNPDKLYKRICIAALWLALIPVAGKYFIIGISALLIFSVNSNFLILAAFGVCMVVFVFPLFLLGTVTPSLAKYTMRGLQDNGKIVGTLGAANTIGSILGTFLPTFVTIPGVGTNVTFLIFSGILLLLCLLYFFSGKTHRGLGTAGLAVFLGASLLGHRTGFAFWENPDSILYEGESTYNYLQVREEGNQVILSTNVLFGVQSVLEKEKRLTGMYYDYAMAAPLMAGASLGKETNVLILGMGTGTFALQCSRYLENMHFEGVEIDEKITKLARRYFRLPENIPVITYDGRAYLDGVDKTYDVIMVDAYQDITIPFQMSSVEFFTSVKEHLKPDGILVVNMNMRGEQEGSINACLADTISSVFPSVYTVDVANSTNRELFASESPAMLQRLEEGIAALPQEQELADMMARVREGLTVYEPGGYLLTDDKAPVELLGMGMMDSIIRSEVNYYKDIYHQEGWQGVLERLR